MSPTRVALRGVLLNKRLTGYANLRFRRSRNYLREHLLAVLAKAADEADHVVVTGDITNLSLEAEYEEALQLLDEVARTAEVTVIPGNHDIYLPMTLRERRFPHHFARMMKSDLPELALDLPAGQFPFVKLRGPAALIGLSSAVPRPPFVSAGVLGGEQRAALSRVLRHPEVQRRTPVVMVHHPPFDSPLPLEQMRSGLVDAAALRSTLEPVERGLLLYGHLHIRRHHALRTGAGMLNALCATAAGLEDPSPRVRAGFNLYELDDDGQVARIEAHVLEWQRHSEPPHRFVSAELPLQAS